MGLGVAIGERAPDVAVEDPEGRTVRISADLARGPTMIVFYRGGWCPYCNFQIRELTTAYPEIERRHVGVVAISVDRSEESARTQATYDIPFALRSDPDLSAHEAFRVVHHVEPEELERLRGFGMDLERASGSTHHVIAIPSIFLVDRTGVVRWAHVEPDYKTRPSVAQLLAVLDDLRL